MGDVKTPDFDDLLAAFDIPDIDAIQSSQKEDEVSAHERKTSSSFSGSPTSYTEPPAVSVIVMNTVRPCEDDDGGQKGNPTNTLLDSPLKTDDTTSAGHISNGFNGSATRDQQESSTAPWRQLNDDDEQNVMEVGSVRNEIEDVISSKTRSQLDSTELSIHSSLQSSFPHKEELHLPHSPSSPLPQNGSVCKKNVTHLDEDDSEPDLGSPLVIHESPEFIMPSPPKLKHSIRHQSELCISPETTLSTLPHSSSSVSLEALTEQERKPFSLSAAPFPGPQNCHIAPVQEEKYPEHVIDERDSPESPPPSETGLAFPPKSPESGKETMDNEPRQNDTPNHNGKTVGDGQTVNETASNNVSPKTVPSDLLPLKVKIKVPAGSLTKTTIKRDQRANSKGAKSSSQAHNTRSKRGGSYPSLAGLPEMTLKEKRSVAVKAKASPTVVSIAKTASLPSMTASTTRPGGVNLRCLGHKTLQSSPQGNSRPASIVNSGGAIISKSQTNLVASFNKILTNKNLLPSYKPDLSSPPPAEWGLPLPAQGYRCLECGDAFALEQSLARHYDRRSLRIEVTCNHCAKRLAFYNKCSLLLHAREHKERGLIMQCSHLVMKPVPLEQMISQNELNGQSTLQTRAQPHQVTSNKKTDAVQHVGNKCTECQTQFSSKKEVVQHFQEIKQAESTPCMECSPPMLLPNACSAAAHQRIHQGSLPCVCPECGGTAKQALFQEHLDHACLHFSRRIGYRCSSCLVVFGGLNSVKGHIQQAHCDIFHKCPTCPMAFKSAASVQSHISTQHPALTEAQAMLIYKCVMCDTVFTHKSLLYVHFETHLTNQKVHVYKCPECTKMFHQRSVLMEHFKSHNSSKQELASTPAVVSSGPKPGVKQESSDGEDGMEEVNTATTSATTGWKCVHCHECYADSEKFVTHMAKQHGKVLKSFPCNKCESSFSSTSSLRRHAREKHKAMIRFRCQFCRGSKKTFSTRAMLDKHIQLQHSTEAMSQEGATDEADSASENDGAVLTRRRRRGAAKPEHDEESIPVKRLRSAVAPYCPPESGFRCAPCGFTTEDQATFQTHISQHRVAAEGGGQQCTHCGACFTSANSLARHLFITHKVRDAFSYQHQGQTVSGPSSPVNSKKPDENFLGCPVSPSSQTQAKDDDDTLNCKVCGKHFDKATDLNTHFRTHGMAFINARNPGKPT
ncbi:zinc finger protein 687a [Syngnathoides biaculeatus]|uniref:zinc finger protein 687a n=1 Tax=Syngnathoides biaculeatus TaxID=300417 RepID=UPI002ADD76FE|nr:zinc finger protein 687a [Syngnathoides biaculeatus]XP_061676499.1 zinc finger protein 687a [Syngnathoides biaculeatus]XP_061676500.1 zinc finger protein 687a [Syngnathoides biaculeatus]